MQAPMDATLPIISKKPSPIHEPVPPIISDEMKINTSRIAPAVAEIMIIIRVKLSYCIKFVLNTFQILQVNQHKSKKYSIKKERDEIISRNNLHDVRRLLLSQQKHYYAEIV